MLAANLAKRMREMQRWCGEVAQQLDGWDAMHAEHLSLRNYLNSLSVQIETDGIPKGDTAHTDLIHMLLTQHRTKAESGATRGVGG